MLVFVWMSVVGVVRVFVRVVVRVRMRGITVFVLVFVDKLVMFAFIFRTATAILAHVILLVVSMSWTHPNE